MLKTLLLFIIILAGAISASAEHAPQPLYDTGWSGNGTNTSSPAEMPEKGTIIVQNNLPVQGVETNPAPAESAKPPVQGPPAPAVQAKSMEKAEQTANAPVAQEPAGTPASMSDDPIETARAHINVLLSTLEQNREARKASKAPEKVTKVQLARWNAERQLDLAKFDEEEEGYKANLRALDELEERRQNARTASANASEAVRALQESLRRAESEEKANKASLDAIITDTQNALASVKESKPITLQPVVLTTKVTKTNTSVTVPEVPQTPKASKRKQKKETEAPPATEAPAIAETPEAPQQAPVWSGVTAPEVPETSRSARRLRKSRARQAKVRVENENECSAPVVKKQKRTRRHPKQESGWVKVMSFTTPSDDTDSTSSTSASTTEDGPRMGDRLQAKMAQLRAIRMKYEAALDAKHGAGFRERNASQYRRQSHPEIDKI